jgi:hypothetical protein
MVGQHSRPVSIAARSLRQNSSSCFWRRAIASTLPSSMTRFRFDMVPPPTIRAGDAFTRQRSRESAFVILMFWSFPHPKHIKQCGRFRGSPTALGQTSGAILEASNCHLSSPDSVRSFLMFRRGSNPCECNVFILELKLNVHCASAANLHSRRTRMKQIWSPPCAHMMQPMRERVGRDWEDQPRYKRKKA